MTNHPYATRRYFAACIQTRTPDDVKPIDCSETERDEVSTATTADALKALQKHVERLESRLRALENPA